MVLENNHGGFVTEIFAFERTSCLLTTAKILGAELFWLFSESRCAASKRSGLLRSAAMRGIDHADALFIYIKGVVVKMLYVLWLV